MKILHLIPADGKTHQLIAARFAEVGSTENRYLVYASNVAGWKPAASDKKGNTLQFVEASYFLSAKCRADVRWCDVLMIHYLTPWAAFVALHARKELPVFWCGWGGDYFRHISSVVGELVLPGTASIPTQADVLKRQRLVNPLRLAIHWAKEILRAMLFYRWESRIIRRVDYFSSPIPEDYELLKRACADFRAKYHQLSYGSVEALFQSGQSPAIRDDILVGNSATPTNNHIEIFQQLGRLDIGKRKLIVPLSYGDATYREEIIRIGHAMFGANFFPLTQFMPLADYNRVIASCGIAIMNHKRQQALGNINTMLYQGAKVFLNPDSAVYSFFRNRGAHVYPVDELGGSGEDAFSPLTEEQVRKNRSVLEEFWGHDTVTNNIRRLADVIAKHEQD